MKAVFTGALVTLALALGACDEGSSKDPATESRNALQPPTGLMTVTLDKKLELRWKGANVEDEFKGYHVFVMPLKISSLGAVAYPSAPTVDLKTGSIPRCKDNTAIFEAFKFTASEADCEGGESESAGTAEGGAEGETAYLQDDGAAEAEGGDEGGTDDEGPLTNKVLCEGKGDDTISYVGAAPSLGDIACVVSKDSTGADLVNGTTYTVFVAAVTGDEKNKISWTSNFVEDTPAVAMFEAAAPGFVIEGAGDKGYLIPEASITGKAPFAATAIVPTACVEKFCTINKTNDLAAKGIYIGRLGGASSYPQRAFISVPTGGAIEILARGPQVFDSMDNSFANSIPGDRAADTTYGSGRLYPIYGNQVFDMKVTISGATHYGKIVFGQPTLATGTDPASDITVPLAVTLQTDPSNFNYLVEPDLDF